MSRLRTLATLSGLAAALGSSALAAAGCSSAPAATQAPKPAEVTAAGLGPPSPARYFVTGTLGAIYDEASPGIAVPRSELALVRGHRVKLDGGAIVTVQRSPSGLVGFRSLPAHLGGGYLVWSDLRTYHATDFLGALTPVAEVAPTAGARPWFSSVLLRTARGIFELDPKTFAVKKWRVHPGVTDALAIDDKRGVTLDVMGRVRATTDGGATWTDVTATRGFLASSVRLGKKSEIQLLSLTGQAELQLVPGASAVEPTPPPPAPFARRYSGYGSYPYQYMNQPPPPENEPIAPVSQELAPETLSWAVAAGVLLPGDRALVGDGSGLHVLSTRTGNTIDTMPLLDLETKYASCQPVRAAGALLLACAHIEGAHVLSVDGAAAAPRLEATFPGAGAFVSDDRGHLAFTGRCGRTPPSVDDFGARVVQRMPYEEEDPYGYGYGPGYGQGYGPYGGYGGYDPEYSEYPLEPVEPDKPANDEKRVCVRLDGGDWIEHRLTGDDARDLYRWVLGDDGHVTALLLKGVNPEEDEDPDKKPEGDEDDESLRRRDYGGGLIRRGSSLLATPTVTPASPPAPSASSAPRARPATTASPSARPSAGKPPAKPAGSARPDAGVKPAPKATPGTARPDASAKPKVTPPKESLRRVRLDPKDRLLKKAKWIHVASPLEEPPWRSIDPSYWLEPDGSVRGWVRLEDEGSSGGDAPDGDGEGGDKPELVSSEHGGRFAGVRISPQGKTTILPLPRDTQSVIFGGRFGMARAEDEDGDRTTYFETTDGGASWTEVEGPPVGDLEDAYEASRWPACSPLGCVLSYGLVRLGWGSNKPGPPKKDKAAPPATGDDPFPVPRMPKLTCTFDGEPDAFPARPPKPKAAPAPPPKPAPTSKVPVPGLDEEMLSQLPPDLQEILRAQAASAGSGSAGTSPSAPPSPSGTPKAAKPPAPPKPPPAPPAEIVSVRTKPQAPLGQLKDKSWIADFIVPFDTAASGPRHVSVAANGLDRVQGNVVPLLGDRGVELLLTWDKKRTVLGSAAPAMGPFEHNGRLSGAVSVVLGALGGAGAKPASGAKPPAAGPAIVALDEDRRVLVLVQADASRPVLRTPRIPDPSRGRFAIARRTDAPGVALAWYSMMSGDLFVGNVDVGRAEIGPLTPLASMATLLDGSLPACSTAKPAGPTYEILLELMLPVSVAAHGGKSLFSDTTVPTLALVRASAERLCITGVEVKGGGRPLDLTATFGPKAAAVARSRSSAEDPTKLTFEKLSCLLKEPEPR